MTCRSPPAVAALFDSMEHNTVDRTGARVRHAETLLAHSTWLAFLCDRWQVRRFLFASLSPSPLANTCAWSERAHAIGATQHGARSRRKISASTGKGCTTNAMLRRLQLSLSLALSHSPLSRWQVLRTMGDASMRLGLGLGLGGQVLFEALNY